MISCLIKVDGTSFHGLYASTCAAAMAALALYPDARRISVRPAR
ncbi:MAG: hypothetical protein ACK40S_03535 [Burkholderiaceae bacterium]